jgi:phage tail-like protein
MAPRFRQGHAMATSSRKDPLRNFRFRVEIDNISVAGFSEATIGPALLQSIDYREGTDAPHVRKLPGLAKFGNITLRRGVSDNLELYNWFRHVASGSTPTDRRSMVIVVADESGADAARFVVDNAWPVRYESSDLNAKGNDVLIETLEVVNEGIERV